MTKLFDGQLTDLVQNNSRYNIEIQAVSYALRMEKQRIMELAQRTRTMGFVDDLPEIILDVLAVELRTPYYTSDMTLGQKREIVKNTMQWFCKAGTTAAVEELVAAAFGQGEVVEWFNFTEGEIEPGTFDIITDTRMTEDIVNRFSQIIRYVKNIRSHIRRVLVERHGNMEQHLASCASTTPNNLALNNRKPRDVDSVLRTAAKAGMITAPEEAVYNTTKHQEYISGPVTVKAGTVTSSAGCITNSKPEPRKEQASGAVHFGLGVNAAPKDCIMNHTAPRKMVASGGITFGIALAVRDIHLTILNCPPPSASKVVQPQNAFSAVVANSNIIIQGR